MIDFKQGKLSDRLHFIRSVLGRRDMVMSPDFDIELANIITELVNQENYDQLVKDGVDALLKANKLMIEDKIENKVEFGAELQRVRTYVLDALYRRKKWFIMRLAGADE